MKNKDLGFRKDQMLVIPTQSINMSKTVYNEFESIKSEFKQHHSVVDVTIQAIAPGREKYSEKIKLLDAESTNEIFSCIEFGDSDYLNTYEIPLVAGRNYRKERARGMGEAFILNETAAKELGFLSPDAALNKKLSVMFWKGEIVGIAKDFHFRSLHEKIAPLVYFAPRFNPEYFTVRLNTQNLPETIDFLKKKWATFFPNNPMDYYFLEDDFNSFYRSEEKFATLIFIFSGLAIFIACLGLFGLAFFTTQRRTKEIGIRKVFGASSAWLSFMLSTEFTRWVVLANLVAWPIAYLVMSKWLQNFAYRIEMNWWIFALAGAITLVIALLTVSWQAIRAATANPVEALRYE
jgi:putative ABC transport system permease protein